MVEEKKQPAEIIQGGVTYVQADPYNRPGVYYRLDIGGAPAPGEQYQATFETKETPTPKLTKEQIEEKLQANFPTYEAALQEYQQPTSGVIISQTREITPLEKALQPVTRFEEIVKEKTKFIERKEGDIGAVTLLKGAGIGVRAATVGTITFPYVAGAAIIGPLTKEGQKKYVETMKMGIAPASEEIKKVPSAISAHPLESAGIAIGVAATFFAPKMISRAFKPTIKEAFIESQWETPQGTITGAVVKGRYNIFQKFEAGMKTISKEIPMEEPYKKSVSISDIRIKTGRGIKEAVGVGESVSKKVGEDIALGISKAGLLIRGKKEIGIGGYGEFVSKAVTEDLLATRGRYITTKGTKGLAEGLTKSFKEGKEFTPDISRPPLKEIKPFSAMGMGEIKLTSELIKETLPSLKIKSMALPKIKIGEERELKEEVSLLQIEQTRKSTKPRFMVDIEQGMKEKIGIMNIPRQAQLTIPLESQLSLERQVQLLREYSSEMPKAPRRPSTAFPPPYFFIPPIIPLIPPLGFGGGYRLPRGRKRKGKRAYRYTATLVGVQMGKFLKRRTLKRARKIKVGLGSIGIRYPVMLPEKKQKKSRSRFLFDIFNPFKRIGIERKAKGRYERGLIKSLGL